MTLDTENAAGESAAPTESAAPEATSPPIKRGRGRPPKDPIAAATPKATPIPGDGGAAPKRGRPPKRAAFTESDTDGLAQQIQGLHMIAAQMTGQPIFALSEGESKMLAASVIRMAGEYNLAMSGKTGALVQLLGVCAVIYVPKLVAIKKARAAAVAAIEGLENGAPAVH